MYLRDFVNNDEFRKCVHENLGAWGGGGSGLSTPSPEDSKFSAYYWFKSANNTLPGNFETLSRNENFEFNIVYVGKLLCCSFLDALFFKKKVFISIKKTILYFYRNAKCHPR